MQSLGEMLTYMPVSGAFTAYAKRFVDPSLGFAMGWIYWFSWAMTFALELTAVGLIIQYWNKDLSIGIFIAVSWVVITLFNFLPVGFYGELESGLSMIKIITIVGFMIFACFIDGGIGGREKLGAKYWSNPGAFASYLVPGALGKFVGFWAVLVQAGFAFQGTELVGIAAGETKNPGKEVPAAVKWTFFRIVFFFIGTIIFIGLLIPYDNPDLLSDETDATASPFVIAAKLAGVRYLPGIINGVLLTVVLSAANSNVYSGSRILKGLSDDGFAPKWLGKTFKWNLKNAQKTKRGAEACDEGVIEVNTEDGRVPYYAVICTSILGLIAFLNLSATGGQVFNWLLNITAIAGFITWTSINLCHIFFMRALAAQNISRDTMPFRALWQPFLAYYGLFWNIMIIMTNGFTSFIGTFSIPDFFAAYISLILFAIMYIGHKLVTKSKFVKSSEVDLVEGRLPEWDSAPLLAPKTSIWRKSVSWIM